MPTMEDYCLHSLKKSSPKDNFDCQVYEMTSLRVPLEMGGNLKIIICDNALT